MVDEAHINVNHITPRHPPTSTAPGPSQQAQPQPQNDPPPAYPRIPKYDGVVHTLPATSPLRFDLAFLEVKSFAARNRHPQKDRQKVLRGMRRSLLIMRTAVESHLKPSSPNDAEELRGRVDTVMEGVVVMGMVCRGLGIEMLTAVNPVGKIVLVKEWNGEVERGRVGLVVDAVWRSKVCVSHSRNLGSCANDAGSIAYAGGDDGEIEGGV